MLARRRIAITLLTLTSAAAQAQEYGGFPRPLPPGLSPSGYARPYPPPPPYGPPQPYGPGFPGGGQGYGCLGCSYVGDYYGGNVTVPRPAPPLRIQGQWRNGWWYY